MLNWLTCKLNMFLRPMLVLWAVSAMLDIVVDMIDMDCQRIEYITDMFLWSPIRLSLRTKKKNNLNNGSTKEFLCLNQPISGMA